MKFRTAEEVRQCTVAVIDEYEKCQSLRKSCDKVKLWENTFLDALRRHPSLDDRYRKLQRKFLCEWCGYQGSREVYPCPDCADKRKKYARNNLELRLRFTANQIKYNHPETDITGEWLIAQWHRQEGLDYYTGLPMDFITSETEERNWDVVSVDRMTPGDGYKQSNCVLCTNGTNIAKGKMTAAEFVAFCQSVLAYAEVRDV